MKKDPGPAGPATEHPALTPAHTKVLTRVIDFYHTAFCEDPRGREYLAGRGIADNKIFEGHKIGFAGGTLLNVLPDEGDKKNSSSKSVS